MKNLHVLAALLVLPFLSHAALSQEITPAPAAADATLPQGLLVAPAGVVFVMDTVNQAPSLVQLHAVEIVSNAHPASNLARSQVFLGSKFSVELDGIRANTAIASSTPTLYVRLSGDDPELLRSRVHLIRLLPTKSRRVVAMYSRNAFGGQQAKKFDDVPVVKTDMNAGAWLKLTPVQPLAPGEYGIVFMPKDANLGPDSVYDFTTVTEPKKPV